MDKNILETKTETPSLRVLFTGRSNPVKTDDSPFIYKVFKTALPFFTGLLRLPLAGLAMTIFSVS